MWGEVAGGVDAILFFSDFMCLCALSNVVDSRKMLKAKPVATG